MRSQLMKKAKKEVLEMIESNFINVDFISGLAGDRNITELEIEQFNSLLKNKGNIVYSEIIYTLSHKRFIEEEAVQLWHEILKHKNSLTKLLGRNPGIVISVLDYLYNIYNKINKPVVIPEAKMESIINIAVKDGMTDLFDKSVFEYTLKYEISQHKRANSDFSLMIIDVDNFKSINDKFGHPKGDYVLKMISSLIRDHIRETDTPCRYGGDEFGILMPETRPEDAKIIGERLINSVKENLKKYNVTLSIGISNLGTASKTESASAILEKADSALYVSKENGKGQITVYN